LLKLFGLLATARAGLFPDSFTNSGEQFERISISRVAKLLTEPIPREAAWRKVQIVDARSEMEYAGGHIRGAVNCQHDYYMVQNLYSKLYTPDTLFVLHCEFSHWRGPTAAQNLIDIHKRSNYRKKPLFVVFMDGGYSSFFPWFTELYDGTYWPWEKLDPAKPGTAEFVRLAAEFMKKKSHDSSPL
jgi:rhodanese-related sulfurtransferase